VRVFYLDTSAAMKLLRIEPETEALVQWHRAIAAGPHRIVSSDLIRTELMLAAASFGVSATDVRQLIQALSLLRVTSALCEGAGRLTGLGLRSLDALHLASAMSLLESLDAVVTYDTRFARAARGLGLAVESPN
jgi:predicted nucleic acid-binding protein